MADFVNITIPVFNRPRLTLQTIKSVRSAGQSIPYRLTVVDNGSAPPLPALLRQLHHDGIIDNLFLLPKNVGISAALNVSMDMIEAGCFMRLDNDMLLAGVDWLGKLFALWRHGHPLSNLGATPDFKRIPADVAKMETPDGDLGICTTSLPGAMMLIPREVVDRIGMWNEEYGLFGGDDGDYGLRMNAANFTQYYFNPEGIVSHKGVGTEGKAEKAYLQGHVDRRKEHHELFVHKDGGIGLFPLNYLLYHCCARTWKPVRRYCIADIDEDCVVILKERPEFKTVMDALSRCKAVVDGAVIGRHRPLDDGRIIARLKRITADAGMGLE